MRRVPFGVAPEIEERKAIAASLSQFQPLLDVRTAAELVVLL